MSPLSEPLYPKPDDLTYHPDWDVVVKLSMHYPQVHAALYQWRRGTLTKEQALIAAIHALATSLSVMHGEAMERLQRVEHKVEIVERAMPSGPAKEELMRLGPPRWQCKRCGKERRRCECLHCGNREAITDEPMVPGAAW